MTALTTLQVHVGEQEIEVLADLRSLDIDSNPRFWTLEVICGDSDVRTEIVVYLKAEQLVEVADQLRTAVEELNAYAWGTAEEEKSADA